MSYDRDGGTDPSGALLGGRYRLIERLGSGGSGTVWRAWDEHLEREVAVRQPRLPGDPEDEGYRRAAHRLAHEARAAARVEHPSAVLIHDVVVEEKDGLPWIVMELVRGESLLEALRRGPLPPTEAARIGLAVLGALRAAHAVGIVHRDVKPANVLLGPHRRVVLTDFGITHVQGDGRQSRTTTGEFAGSPEFVAPERLSGTGGGPASDLWSLGAVLYTAVEGVSPFRRTTPEATLAAVLAADPPEPRQAGPLGPLLTALLTKDHALRPDAEAAARLLETASGERDTRGVKEEKAGQTTRTTPELTDPTEPTEPPGVTRVTAAAPAAEPIPQPAAPAAPAPIRRVFLRGTVPLVGVLVAGGIWLGTSVAGGKAESDEWLAHRDDGMNAVLHLPRSYRQLKLVDRAGDNQRLAVYGDDVIDVRFSEWDNAPGAPMAEAKETAPGWEGHARSAGQYTRTSFQGAEAALSDVTYDPDGGGPDRDGGHGNGEPVRVLRLVVRTDDDRMYQLRVDMPKGTADEQKGVSLFRHARDRLEIREI